jgi:SagB-type dehydrogenase family enzyme
MPRTTFVRATKKTVETAARVSLPQPSRSGSVPIEQCLATRRSCRAYGDAPLALAKAGQLLWAAQGITGLGGLRTAPSARAIYPLRLYLFAQRVADLSPGVYRYDPDTHQLEPWSLGERRKRLVRVALKQEWLYDAAGVVLLAADFSSMLREFGDRAHKLTYIECGHVAGNICLEAAALGLGAITVASFDIPEMKRFADLPEAQEPLYMVAAGEKL